MKRTILAIFALAMFFPLFSRDDSEYLFKRLSLDDGLINSSVSSIQQDSRGFMWFGTQSGFSRYDGYDFKSWNHDTFDRNSLPHGLVQTMYMDDEDILWLGTYNGLSRFDPSTEMFKNFEYVEDSENSISNSVVTSIVKTKEETLWVATLNGLNKLDLQSEEITRYFHDESDENSLAHNVVRSLLVDSQNRLWIGTFNGLDLYDPQSDSFRHYNDFPTPYVMSLLEHNDSELLLGVWGSGLIKFNTLTGEGELTPLNDDRVYTLGKDDVGEIWIGTWGSGLFIYDELKNEVHELINDSSDFSTLPHNTVYSLFLDQTGVMWTGTNGGGIAIHNPRMRNYNFLVHDSREEQSIALGKIGAIEEDKEKNLWIGIYNGGVNRFDRSTGEITRYTNSTENPRISDNIVNHIYMDSSENIWAATNNGLNLYNRDTDLFERIYTIEESPDETLTYNVIFEDSQKNLWIGTHNHGLIRYDSNRGETEQYENDPHDKSSLSDNLVYSLLERHNGEFWIGTNKGLNIMDRESGTFKRILLDYNNQDGINNNAIRVLLERENDEIWLGTGGGGINIYAEESGSFSHLTKAEGLSNAFIMSLIEDEEGRIWAGTKYGLSIIDPRSKAITVLSKENGLEDMEFNLGIELAQDGSVLMGASDRIYRFDIDQEEIVNTIESLQILQLENGGEINREYSPYIPNEEIVMDYNSSRIFSFEYSALNYIDAPNTRYIYTLEGFEENWSRESERRYVTYTNIPPGEYTFSVRAYNTFNKDLFETTSQRIVISPPFWMSLWAFLIYALLLSAFIYLIFLASQNHGRKLKFLEMKKAEAYLAGIFDSMPSLLIAIDKDLRITQWNGEAASQYGKTSFQAIGLPLYEACPDFPISKKDLFQGIGSGDLISKMIRHNKGDQPIRFESVSIYPLDIESREGAVIKIDDVTKQIRMEEALVQSEKMLSIGGLAAGMAHEINNPLGGMIQSANVLKNRLYKDNPKNDKAALESGTPFESITSYMEKREIPRLLGSIEEAGHRISDIVDNMRGFSRKENSSFSMVELPLLINKTLDLTSSDYDLKKSYDFKSIKILKDFREVPPVPCEKSQIQQVLLNILRNGAEAMKEKEGPHRFTIRLYREMSSNMAVIEIEDNGSGMAADIKNRVFEPFFTTKPVGIGTGLGLSVSYFIITEHHHGKINVQSRPGEGTVFTIKLPIEKN